MIWGLIIKIAGNIFEYWNIDSILKTWMFSVSFHARNSQDVACFFLRAKIAGDLMRICCWRTRGGDMSAPTSTRTYVLQTHV